MNVVKSLAPRSIWSNSRKLGKSRAEPYGCAGSWFGWVTCSCYGTGVLPIRLTPVAASDGQMLWSQRPPAGAHTQDDVVSPRSLELSRYAVRVFGQPQRIQESPSRDLRVVWFSSRPIRVGIALSFRHGYAGGSVRLGYCDVRERAWIPSRRQRSAPVANRIQPISMPTVCDTVGRRPGSSLHRRAKSAA